MKRQESKDGVREIVLDDGTIRYEARVNRRGEKPLSKRFKSRKDALAWKRSIDADIDRGKRLKSSHAVRFVPSLSSMQKQSLSELLSTTTSSIARSHATPSPRIKLLNTNAQN